MDFEYKKVDKYVFLLTNKLTGKSRIERYELTDDEMIKKSFSYVAEDICVEIFLERDYKAYLKENKL